MLIRTFLIAPYPPVMLRTIGSDRQRRAALDRSPDNSGPVTRQQTVARARLGDTRPEGGTGGTAPRVGDRRDDRVVVGPQDRRTAADRARRRRHPRQLHPGPARLPARPGTGAGRVP